MYLDDIKNDIPEKIYSILEKDNISELRPSQNKAIQAGLLEGKSLLICTPTASGKTLIAELASTKNLLNNKGKAVYICPLKALASEKFKNFKERYGSLLQVSLSIGDSDQAEPWLGNKDWIICTSEKLDSLIRHHAPWVSQISTLVIDEIHLLNSPNRGPTLEIIITLLKRLVKDVQIIGLSATIGNPQELADWLGADLVIDNWRPVPLEQGVYIDGKIHFPE